MPLQRYLNVWNSHFRTDITKDHITTMSKTYIPESIAEGSYRGEGRYKNFKMKTKGYFNVTASRFLNSK